MALCYSQLRFWKFLKNTFQNKSETMHEMTFKDEEVTTKHKKTQAQKTTKYMQPDN